MMIINNIETFDKTSIAKNFNIFIKEIARLKFSQQKLSLYLQQ